MKPAVRTDLALRELDDEAVLYDFRRQKAHCLNAGALAVFKLSDGKHTTGQIARALGCDEAVVWTALIELDKEQLLKTPLGPRRVDLGRRRLLKKAALTAGLTIATPAIWSILAPTPAYAASKSTCFPASSCMGVEIPTGCCNNGGTAATCSGVSMCMGMGSSCTTNGQRCQ